jgi:phosphoglycolate phosphatase-like HAD superfamily hydrolase
MKKAFILFDFDGVIADSFEPAFEVTRLMCPHVTEDEYRKQFEGNINDWEVPANIHNDDCRTDIDFFQEYIPRMKKQARIVPGIVEVIRWLEKEYTLIVISSTITSPIREFLEEHDLAKHFAEIMGNDVHKSKVEKIKMVFDLYQAEAKRCVFITDTLGDMREASRVDVDAIGVTWGFQSTETLQKGTPFRLVDKPEDLIEAIHDCFARIN